MPNLWKTLLIAAIVALAALLMLMGTKRSQNPSPSPPQASSVQKAEPGTPSPSNERIWQGTLSVGGTQLRLILHVTKAPNGSLTAKLDSLDQGALGLPIDRIALTDQSLQFEMTQIGASYKGTLNSDGSEIVGEWTQGGVSLPLTFKRIEQAPIVRRPQEPTKPYPYQAEDVSFRNQTASVTLAGTLTLPSGKGPFPAVILTAGSGPVDRDETVAGHRIFLVLADYLTRHGIAVLRYDKRGVGQSTGDFPAATTEDFANDALAAVAYLKNRPEINPKEIGLVGHSEGGLIAPMVVSRSSDVAFIVLMAGPGVTGEEILLKQTELILRANGMSETTLAKIRTLQQDIFAVVKAEPDNAKAARAIRGIIQTETAKFSDEEKQQAGISLEASDAAIQQYLSPWFRFFLTYDPKPTLTKLRVPVLAINGANDLQVPPQQNLPVIAEALAAGGNGDYAVVELPKLNHLFQTSETGSPTEYAKIEETIAPVALDVIASWILSHVK